MKALLPPKDRIRAAPLAQARAGEDADRAPVPDPNGSAAVGAPRPDPTDHVADPWTDAVQVALLFAVDPVGCSGVVLRAAAGPLRDRWLALLRALLPTGVPLQRVPLHIADARLLGGLDLAATLRAGRPVAQQGLLAQCDGGVLLLAMAERLTAGTAARLAAVLDTQQVAMERDGLTQRPSARLGLVALDEGLADDEQLPGALRERLAFRIELDPALMRQRPEMSHHSFDAQPDRSPDEWPGARPGDVLAARALLPQVRCGDELLQALCATALALGVDSVRAPLLALRAACAAAALDGRTEVDERDASIAARLVLAPRATQLPVAEPAPDEAPQTESDPASAPDEPPPSSATPPPEQQADSALDRGDDRDDADADADPPPLDPAVLDDLILQAAQAAIPPGLLAALKIGQQLKTRGASAGRSGQVRQSQRRGRPSGVRRGEPRAGARLNVIETLRAAAPWQRLRQLEAGLEAGREMHERPDPQRIQVRREDFHVTRYRQHGETTTVFVVDASGSSALNRLAEAKGAVEMLLAECYVRRDRVAVLAFRGSGAELLLPPTRSLVRAKRSLAGLPGGGGTPLAAGIDAASALADAIQRRGDTAVVVLLTDGRGNIARDGSPGRQKAGDDALAAARQLRLAGITALLIDTSPQAHPSGRQLALQMGAVYLPLPHAGAAAVSQAVRAASAAAASAATR